MEWEEGPMERVERIEHEMTCDCGAKLPVVFVKVYEEGAASGGLKETRFEGKEWWDHLFRCAGMRH